MGGSCIYTLNKETEVGVIGVTIFKDHCGVAIWIPLLLLKFKLEGEFMTQMWEKGGEWHGNQNRKFLYSQDCPYLSCAQFPPHGGQCRAAHSCWRAGIL